MQKLIQILLISFLIAGCDSHSIPKQFKDPKVPPGPGNSVTGPWEVSDVEGLWASKCVEFDPTTYIRFVAAIENNSFGYYQCVYTGSSNCQNKVGGSLMNQPPLAMTFHPDELSSEFGLSRDGSYFYGSPILFWIPNSSRDELAIAVLDDDRPINTLYTDFREFFDGDLSLLDTYGLLSDGSTAYHRYDRISGYDDIDCY